MASLLLAAPAFAELSWMTDLPKALEKAKAENKVVMMGFTGSDWCSTCIKLHKEVFSTPEFASYAKKNLVPVEVDFPKKKVLSAEQKQANSDLKEKYKIEGYPTIIVLNSKGEKLGEFIYEEGGPKNFIAKLDELKKK